MSNKKRIGIDLGFATLTVGILAFIASLITVFKDDLSTCIGSLNLSSSSEEFESGNSSGGSDSDSKSYDSGSNSALSSSDSGSKSYSSESSSTTDSSESSSTTDSSESSSSDSDSNPSNGSESDKNNLFTDEKGRVELFDNHSGIAYIYKKFLDEKPIGLIDEYGDYKIIGWSIHLTCDNKSLSFNTTSQNDDESQLHCSAQYSINEKPQSIILNDLKVNYETNGDLRIEFDFDSVPFDLRDSSSDIIINELYIKISI